VLPAYLEQFTPAGPLSLGNAIKGFLKEEGIKDNTEGLKKSVPLPLPAPSTSQQVTPARSRALLHRGHLHRLISGNKRV